MTQAGQTMVETMLVVGLVAGFALVTADAFLPAASRNQVLAVRAELAAELRVARHLAMTARRAMRVRVEAGGTRVVTEALEDGASVARVLDLSGKGAVVDRLSNGSAIVFYASGRAATPTTVTLRGIRDGTRDLLTVSITGRVSLK